MTKAELVEAVGDRIAELMLVILAAYEPLPEDEWFQLCEIAFHNMHELPDPETFHAKDDDV